MEGNQKSVSIHCTRTGIHVDGANNIGSTSDTIVSCKRSFLRVCEVWWNTYCGRDDEDGQKRNCDVGTAEEQAERYGRYCDKFTRDGMHCEACPCCGKIPFGKCEFAWAQMPYEGDGR